jgi:hypothetical protein
MELPDGIPTWYEGELEVNGEKDARDARVEDAILVSVYS